MERALMISFTTYDREGGLVCITWPTESVKIPFSGKFLAIYC